MRVLLQFLPLAAKYFDAIPGLSKLKGYRSLIGLVGLALLGLFNLTGKVPTEVNAVLQPILLGYTGFALNASGRK